MDHAFGVLQARIANMCGIAYLWSHSTPNYIMKTYMILHNMIIEDEYDVDGAKCFDYERIPKSIPVRL